eukprot:4878730-Amphidinium_carterae.1
MHRVLVSNRPVQGLPHCNSLVLFSLCVSLRFAVEAVGAIRKAEVLQCKAERCRSRVRHCSVANLLPFGGEASSSLPSSC